MGWVGRHWRLRRVLCLLPLPLGVGEAVKAPGPVSVSVSHPDFALSPCHSSSQPKCTSYLDINLLQILKKNSLSPYWVLGMGQRTWV